MTKPLALLLLAWSQSGVALNIECGEEAGRVFGQIGRGSNPERVDESDNSDGSKVTITIDDQVGKVVTGSFSYSISMILETPEQVSFSTKIADTVWLYSYFPKASILLTTHHTEAILEPQGGGIAYTAIAKCSVRKDSTIQR